MKVDRELVKRIFQEYTARYDLSDPKIRLKVDHTYRVAQWSEQIADSLEERQEGDADLAWLAGMLHDLGRFEQIRRYGTFSDAESIDHAQLAVTLLFEDRLLTDYLCISPELSWEQLCREREVQILRTAIANHSAYRIEDGLDSRTQRFCHILRDADKIDIFRVVCDTPLEEIYGFETEALLRSGITREVEQAFYEHHAVLRSLKKQPADFIVANASLVFELVYPESRKMALEQGYVHKILSFSSENPETAACFARMREHFLEE